MAYLTVRVGEWFSAVRGSSRYTRTFIENNPGQYPVYSAALAGPLGHSQVFDFDGEHLTWTTNGYAGSMQTVGGRFSANGDRGVLLPRSDVPELPDLDFFRKTLEPRLRAIAVGRRVDGRRNEFTKLAPAAVEKVKVTLPATASGRPDFDRMRAIGRKIRTTEHSIGELLARRDEILSSNLGLSSQATFKTVSLGDESFFKLSIGKRVLRKDLSAAGVPVFSANVREPFGSLPRPRAGDAFDSPSLIWGIDGVFDWRAIPSGSPFVSTDHCGRALVVSDLIDVRFAERWLRSTRLRYGFDRTFRANLRNIADVELALPLDEHGEVSIALQRQQLERYDELDKLRDSALASIDRVVQAASSVTWFAADE